MTKIIRTRWTNYLDQQHRYPSGIVGQFIGERMLRQHALETAWSIALLDLQATDRVLEVGFGAGRGLQLALQQSSEVVGMDMSSRMLRVAAQRNRAAYQRQQLALLRGDMAHPPFANRSLDKIVSVHTFYFWPDARATSLQFAKLLRPGGRLVITFATAQTLANGERTYWPLHQHAETLVQTYAADPVLHATLIIGPDSRQFNNIAIVIDNQM